MKKCKDSYVQKFLPKKYNLNNEDTMKIARQPGLKSCCSVNSATQAEDVNITGYLEKNACQWLKAGP